MAKPQPKKLPAIGWREWVMLPELGIRRIKAKIDTGARSSSLHAFDIESRAVDGVEYVRFKVQPHQSDLTKVVHAEARVLEFRKVRSSSGHSSLRPVIMTAVAVLGQQHKIEVTLVDRGKMGFRMLLGREAIRGRYLVDSASSYYGGKPRKKKKHIISQEHRS